MSIMIKGMEMPKSCFACPFRRKVDPDNIMCIVTREVFEETFAGTIETRNRGNCPLAPIPKHGRLIDADAAVEKLKKLREYHRDDSHSGVFIASGISQCIEVLTGKDAPTIIEAEEESSNVE